ncbi:MAG: histidinol-phosphate transaminase [Pseudomonadota bacterium]|nr:histidinol-phosphate transaminase [Pseudomonadota bacterium]
MKNTSAILPTAYDMSTLPPFVVRGDGGTIDTTYINLSANESPFGPSANVEEVILSQKYSVNRYPDMSSFELKKTIAELHNLDPKKIICGNGSDSIIFNIALTYASRKHEVIMSKYSFTMFKRAAISAGAIPVVVDEENYSFCAERALEAVSEKTRVVFIANPNNPTGSFMTMDELVRFREKLPQNILLVIDDAYQEYAENKGCPNGLDLAKKWSNIIVTRTMSKVYALAALRVGWAYASQDVSDNLNRLRQPFNINGIAQPAAIAALKDQSFVSRNVDHNDKWQPFLSSQLGSLGLESLPSAGNFLTVRFPENEEHNATSALRFLYTKKIIARTTADYEMPNFMRITIGSEQENLLLLDALTNFLRP